MEITNYLPIFYITLLIVISGMFSGSETSVTSVNRSKIHKLANKGDKKAKKLLNLIDNKNDLISSILVGNNIVNIFASVLATAVLIEYFGNDGIFYSNYCDDLLNRYFGGHAKEYSFNKSRKVRAFFFKSSYFICKIFYPIIYPKSY